MLKTLEQWLFPGICCLCEHHSETTQDLCTVCKALLPWAIDRCYRCGLQLLDGQDAVDCEQCRQKPFAFDRLCTLFNYEQPLTQLITGLKFAAKLAYGRVLGELLAEAVNHTWYQKIPLPEIIIPMPLHERRLKKRGFNQALELALPSSKQLKIPINSHFCKRIVFTKPQSRLDAYRRRNNIKNAFEINRKYQFEHVAIVDDVVTTGSTVNALSLALKAKGVKQIDVWCICRA